MRSKPKEVKVEEEGVCYLAICIDMYVSECKTREGIHEGIKGSSLAMITSRCRTEIESPLCLRAEEETK